LKAIVPIKTHIRIICLLWYLSWEKAKFLILKSELFFQ
jgi:hypothetical protein